MSVTTLTSLERPHYNLRQTLLQFAYIYKYYKMLQPLLQIAQVGFITKCCNRYYKMRNLLQNASLLQNAAEHYVRKYHTNQNGNFNANKLSSFLLDKTVKLLYEKEIGSKER